MKAANKKTAKDENPFMKFFKSYFKAKAPEFKAVLGILVFGVLLVGCNSGSSGNSSSNDPASSSSLLSGIFVDSAVEGLEYETETQSGMTDADGTFMYMPGETITFYIGDIMLGGAMAQAIMTPVDLVEGAVDETHPMVTNMARFLQTLDADMDPENGITINQEMADAMIGHMVDFDVDMDAFEYSQDMLAVMDAIHMMGSSWEEHMLVSIEDAQNHLSNTMADMMNGDYSMMSNSMAGGNYPGTGTGNTGMVPGDQTGMPGGDTGGMMSPGNDMM